MKKRHSWGTLEKLKFTEKQKCLKCKLIRFKIMGHWAYSKKENEDMLVPTVQNLGCK